MASGKTRALVLIHQRTELRYPLDGGDFIIGRSTGNLVFDHDPKLSGKHCLIRASEEGLAIYDLKTRTGILINGAPLPTGKACVLKAGSQFTVGDQCFRVEKDRRHHDRSRLPAVYTSLAVVLFIAVGGAMMFPLAGRAVAPTALNEPMSKIEGELNEAMLHYQALGDAIRQRQLDEQQSLALIRQDLLPRFTRVQGQLESYRPAQAKPAARAELQQRLVGAFIGQLSAMGNFIETKDSRFATELNTYNTRLRTLTDALRAQGQTLPQRQPSSTK